MFPRATKRSLVHCRANRNRRTHSQCARSLCCCTLLLRHSTESSFQWISARFSVTLSLRPAAPHVVAPRSRSRATEVNCSHGSSTLPWTPIADAFCCFPGYTQTRRDCVLPAGHRIRHQPHMAADLLAPTVLWTFCGTAGGVSSATSAALTCLSVVSCSIPRRNVVCIYTRPMLHLGTSCEQNALRSRTPRGGTLHRVLGLGPHVPRSRHLIGRRR